MAVRKHVTLVANVAQSVPLASFASREVEVISHGSGPVYARADGTAATVAGDDTHVALAGGFCILNARSDRDGTVTVSVISAVGQTCSVGLVELP